MGSIYPTVTLSDSQGRPISLETASHRTEFTMTRSEPGLKSMLKYSLVSEETVRSDCFCCSCKDDGLGYDPSCRNHGNGLVGERPCEIHGMPGSVDHDGDMPSSVQEARKR